MPPFILFIFLLRQPKIFLAQCGFTLADIAQLGERQTEDLKVPGSIPGVGIALVAQSVEHGSNKPRVGGSSPSWSIAFWFLQPAPARFGFQCHAPLPKPTSVL